MTTESTGIITPKNPTTLVKIKQAMQQITNAKARIAGEREYIKNTIAELSKETEIDKADLRALSGVVEDGSVDAVVNHAIELESLFNAINKPISTIYEDAKAEGNDVPEDERIKDIPTIA